MENELEMLMENYTMLLDKQAFIPKLLDYSVMEKHRPLLQSLAQLGNSGISVFDLYRREHVFYSPNFCTLLGYDRQLIEQKGHGYWDQKIHPDDFLQLTRNGVMLMKLLFRLPDEDQRNHKLINEYRFLNSHDEYIRIVEQHQLLEKDALGNVWLTLSIVDISPDQDSSEGMVSQLFNFRTGKIIPFPNQVGKKKDETVISLTQREIQILNLVKDGLLSKEISDRLSISVHTVNTHRQRVLEKLGANNSMEAVVFASKLGLL
jgi:DNA-binding CsgD family transcriptional regulator